MKETLWKIAVTTGNVQKQMLVVNLRYFTKSLSPAPLQFQIPGLRPRYGCVVIVYISSLVLDLSDNCFVLFFTYEGGTVLTISGFGFNKNSKVLVGNETCSIIEGDLDKITCRTPKVRHLISVIFFLSLISDKLKNISVEG